MKKRRNLYIIIGLVIAVAACVAAYTIWRSQKSQKSQVKVVTVSTDNPEEKAPGKDYQWQGGAEDPKKIVISKINVDSFVQQVGVDQNNEVAVPTNLFLVGWFVKTVQPGKTGLSVFDGHVSGRRNDGVFKNLDQLTEGDTYTVELGSGKKLTYQVMGKQTLPEKESVSAIFSQDPSVKSQLNLVTCAGTYNEQTREYPDRLVVTAKLIQ